MKNLLLFALIGLSVSEVLVAGPDKNGSSSNNQVRETYDAAKKSGKRFKSDTDKTKLVYVKDGQSAGDGMVWQWNGSSWKKVAAPKNK